jgi:SPP1 gp7 family putative phage head morphogenesis protein
VALDEGVETPQWLAVEPVLVKVERLIAKVLLALGDELSLVEAAALAADPRLPLPLDLAERMREVIDPAYREVFALAGKAVAESLGVRVAKASRADERVFDIAVGVPVDPAALQSGFILELTAETPRSIAYAERRAGQLIKGLDAGQREAVRTLLSGAIREGLPVREIAPLVRSVIGLDPRQTTALLNLRQSLLKDGMSPAKLTARTEAYRNKAIRQRARLIARTEVMDAMNAGVQDGWEQMEGRGVFPRGYVVREWLASFDERTCVICAPLDGLRVGIDDTFDGYDRPPAHPACRCTMGLTTVDEPISSPFRLGERLPGGGD